MTLKYGDGKPVQVGDKVTVEGTITSIAYGTESPLCVTIPHGAWWVNPKDIVSHTPAPIKVGDKVLWGTHPTRYEVIAIHDGKAWISLRKGANFIVCLSQLRKAPE